ncbi:unnamed protein product [Gongylonema pulchrum]|uniref:Protein RFT1 homolog n=1 Tax=Gongylonema pulchrum TaxID=637853 RepID=A0A183E4R6_9BILA|nr:unnamed protein product [Gongylonema pulchrum]
MAVVPNSNVFGTAAAATMDDSGDERRNSAAESSLSAWRYNRTVRYLLIFLCFLNIYANLKCILARVRILSPVSTLQLSNVRSSVFAVWHAVVRSLGVPVAGICGVLILEV